MIYTLYFTGLGLVRNVTGGFGNKAQWVDVPATLTKQLENSKDTFIFVITPSQQESWDNVAEAHNWKRFVHFEMKDFVHNVNYPSEGRRLKLIVLKGIAQ